MFWGHEYVQGSAKCAQQSACEVPVAQMPGSGDKPPWGCQHGLQVLKAMYVMHIALLYGESAAIKRQQVRKHVSKVPEHSVCLLLDLTGACRREHACQIVSDRSVFSRHAMA